MLPAVGHAILAQQWARLPQCFRQGLVNRRVAQRSSPGAAREDGRLFPPRIMPHAENYDFFGQRDAPEHVTRYVSRINITRVRHEARSYWNARSSRIGLCESVNESCEFRGIGRIKASGNSRQAKHAAAPRIRQASKDFP